MNDGDTMPTTCPEQSVLESVLTSDLPEPELKALGTHLEQCPGCRETLERLAAGGAGLTDERADPSSPESAFIRLMRHLQDQTVPSAEHELHFLRPSEKPGVLGLLGPYEVTEVVGRGGMGVVLRALDPSLNRYVAIKVLAPQLATTVAARKRFAREARAAAAISHEHVVAVLAVDEIEGLPYLVMAYVPGLSLQQRLDRAGPLEVKEILRIGMQVASGLAAAHAQGVIHRDIKPANILLENGVERVKITDFGLARIVDDASLTQSGILTGTPQYMAPEQARGEPQDHRADLFSLGSVLYALCTGHPPFNAETTMGILRRVSDERPRNANAANPDVPIWLAAIIDKLLQKAPNERFQSAAEVADLLSRHLAHLQQPALIPFPGAKRRSLSRRHKILAAAAGVLLLLTLGLSEALGATKLGDFVATVLRIRTPYGVLRVEIEDPAVDVSVDDEGKEIAITGAGVHEIRLRPGDHRWKAVKDGKAIRDEVITISSNGKELVKITVEQDEKLARSTPQDRAKETTSASEVQRLMYAAAINQAQMQWDRWAETHPASSQGKGALVSIPHPDRVTSVAFWPDSQTLLTGCQDSHVRAWKLRWQKTQTAAQGLQAKLDEQRALSKQKLHADLEADVMRLQLEIKEEELRIQRGLVKVEQKELAERRQRLKKLAEAAGSSNPFTLEMRRQFKELEIKEKQQELIALERDLRKARTEASQTNSDVVLGANELERAFSEEPNIREFDEEIATWEKRLASMAQKYKDGMKAPQLAGTVTKLEKLKASRQECVNQIRPWVESKLVRQHKADIAERAKAARERALFVEQARTVLRREIDELTEALRSMQQFTDAKRQMAEEDERSAKVTESEQHLQLLIDKEAVLRDMQESLMNDITQLTSQANKAVEHVECTWELLREFSALDGGVRSLAVSSDGQMVAAAGRDGRIRLWNMGNGFETANYHHPGHQIVGLQFVPGSRTLISGSEDGVVIWRLPAEPTLPPRIRTANPLTAVAVTPDGKAIVTAHSGSSSASAYLCLSEVPSSKKVRELTGVEAPVKTVSVSPDGRTVVAGNGHSLTAWDLATGRKLYQSAAQDTVTSVRFSPDGKLVVSAGGKDPTVWFWNAGTGSLIRQLKTNGGPITSLAFSPDGQMLATSSDDKSVRIWRVNQH
jgi:serine/threonine protein kinase/WD40 repeat protein